MNREAITRLQCDSEDICIGWSFVRDHLVTGCFVVDAAVFNLPEVVPGSP